MSSWRTCTSRMTDLTNNHANLVHLVHPDERHRSRLYIHARITFGSKWFVDICGEVVFLRNTSVVLGSDVFPMDDSTASREMGKSLLLEYLNVSSSNIYRERDSVWIS